MHQNDEVDQQSQDDEEIDKWVNRDLDDILNEAEKEGFTRAAKEMAEQGGWIEPETPEEYLMWFEVLVENAVKGLLDYPDHWSVTLYEVHHLAGYAAEIRCFGIKPASHPWECGVFQLNPKILEGMKTIVKLVRKYGRTEINFMGEVFPQILLYRAVAEFDDIELSGPGEVGQTGQQSEVLLIRNLAEQFTYVALCHDRGRVPQGFLHEEWSREKGSDKIKPSGRRRKKRTKDGRTSLARKECRDPDRHQRMAASASQSHLCRDRGRGA